jgi:Leucine-rich repeat (LRR) protein
VILPRIEPSLTSRQRQSDTLRDTYLAGIETRGEGVAQELHIRLNSNKVNDAALKELQGLKVNTLVLDHTAVSDAGLEKLKDLTSLQALDLSFTQVTDAGLAHLGALPNLRTLNLTGTRVTDQGVAQLKVARPNLVVKR